MREKTSSQAPLREELERFRGELERYRSSPYYREIAEQYARMKEHPTVKQIRKLAEHLHNQVAQRPDPPPTKGRGPYRKRQRDKIDAALKKRFPPDGKPSATVENHEILATIADELGDRTGKSDSTILRRAGRKK